MKDRKHSWKAPEDVFPLVNGANFVVLNVELTLVEIA